jgi:hypothetical protein
MAHYFMLRRLFCNAGRKEEIIGCKGKADSCVIRPVGRFVSAWRQICVHLATGSIPSDRRSVFARLLINLVVEVLYGQDTVDEGEDKTA